MKKILVLTNRMHTFSYISDLLLQSHLTDQLSHLRGSKAVGNILLYLCWFMQYRERIIHISIP